MLSTSQSASNPETEIARYPTQTWSQHYYSKLLDWLYPPFCALCERRLNGGRHLCQSCASDLPRLSPHHCLRCARIFDSTIGTTSWCGNCKEPPPAFDFATAAFEANASTLELIHQFKLLKHPELARDLAAIATPRFLDEKRLQTLSNPLLIPTPLHQSRLAERRFNQSDLLAHFLSKTLEIPLCKALKRTRRTPRQATMRRKERLENVKNAFRLRVNPESLASRDLILIDDVLTTGSTAHACAKALRLAKPSKIVVFTILRA